jgi:hypothetical protein
MISTRKIIFNVRRKLNAFISGEEQEYKLLDLIPLINEAYQIYVTNIIPLAEMDIYYKNILRPLLVKDQKLNFSKNGNKYIASYPKDFYKRVNQIANVSCEGCKENKEIIPRLVFSDKLYEALRSPYRKPSFEWEQLIADDSGDSLHLYLDNKSKLENIRIDYYKKIVPLQAPSLLKCANEYEEPDETIIKEDVDFVLDEDSAIKVEDIAVLIGHRDVKDIEGFQTQLQKYIQRKNLI